MNVLLVTADQWRGDCLGAVGHPAARTPNIDALAADGVLFRRHFAQATPCGPSRASLYTGMYAFNHRPVRNGTPLDARHTNLPLEARRAGYLPVLFGYTDTSADPRGRDPDDPWLRTYEGILPGFEPGLYLPEHAEPWLDHLRRAGHAEASLCWAYDRLLGEPAPFAAEHSETAFVTDAFLEWLASARSPWLAHLSWIKPHPPFVATAPWHALIDPATIPAPVRAPLESEAAVHPWLAWKLAQRHESRWFPAAASLDEARVRVARAVYLGLVAEVDHHFGRVLQPLRRRDLLDDTLVVLTSDHGEMLGDHWLLGKETFHPTAFHVPLVIRDPRGVRGRVVDAFTEHVDLVPTILERIGAQIPLQCDGRTLVPWLEGTTPPWRDAAHFELDFRDLEHGRPETALGLDRDQCQLQVRHGERYTYVHFAELDALCFDHSEDPCRDIAGDPARTPEVLAEAQAILSFRMTMAERRLTGCLLTEAGPIGRY